MLNPKCFTCGKLLADIEIEWIIFCEECDKNTKLSEQDVVEAKAQKLTDLRIESRCCRGNVLSYVQEVKLII